ncbi:MAG: CheR family methyltransferase [Candidatus Omnitrophota bacterium]
MRFRYSIHDGSEARTNPNYQDEGYGSEVLVLIMAMCVNSRIFGEVPIKGFGLNDLPQEEGPGIKSLRKLLMIAGFKKKNRYDYYFDMLGKPVRSSSTVPDKNSLPRQPAEQLLPKSAKEIVQELDRLQRQYHEEHRTLPRAEVFFSLLPKDENSAYFAGGIFGKIAAHEDLKLFVPTGVIDGQSAIRGDIKGPINDTSDNSDLRLGLPNITSGVYRQFRNVTRGQETVASFDDLVLTAKLLIAGGMPAGKHLIIKGQEDVLDTMEFVYKNTAVRSIHTLGELASLPFLRDFGQPSSVEPVLGYTPCSTKPKASSFAKHQHYRFSVKKGDVICKGTTLRIEIADIIPYLLSYRVTRVNGVTGAVVNSATGTVNVKQKPKQMIPGLTITATEISGHRAKIDIFASQGMKLIKMQTFVQLEDKKATSASSSVLTQNYQGIDGSRRGSDNKNLFFGFDKFKNQSASSSAGDSSKGRQPISLSVIKDIIWERTLGGGDNIFEQSTSTVKAVTFSPDGRVIATGDSDGRVSLWDENGVLFDALDGHNKSVNAVTFNFDGSRIATSGDDGAVMIWDGDIYKKLSRLEGHDAAVCSIAFNPANKNELASVSKDGTLKIWNIESGDCIVTLKHPSAVLSVTYKCDGKAVITGTANGNIYVWDRQTGKNFIVAAHGAGEKEYNREINAISASHCGNFIFTGSNDKSIRVWDAHSFKCRRVLSCADSVLAFAVSHDATKVAAGMLGRAPVVYDTQLNKSFNLRGHSSGYYESGYRRGDIRAIAFSPNGKKIVTAGEDAMLWKVNYIRQASSAGSNIVSVSSLTQGNVKAMSGVTAVTGETLQPLKLLTWKDERQVLDHFRALFAELGLPMPHPVAVDGVVIVPAKSLNIVSLRSLANGKSPIQYCQEIQETARRLTDFFNTPFAKEFGIMPYWASWFRYPKQLESIRRYVQGISSDQTVNIIVQATWHGEDAYSLAVFLDALFPRRTFKITGADYVVPNPKLLAWTRERDIPVQLETAIKQYFYQKVSGIFALKDKFLSLVELKQGDVRDPSSFGKDLDIVVMNSVLGQSVTRWKDIEQSIHNAWNALKPNGLLFIDNNSYHSKNFYQRKIVFQVLLDSFWSKFKLVEDGVYQKISTSLAKVSDNSVFPLEKKK